MIDRGEHPVAIPDVDDQFVALLRQHDEILCQGTIAEATSPGGAAHDTPPDGVAELECLHLLRRVWPRPRRNPVDVASRAPARLGRFNIDRVLGQGGFGIVYLATDSKLGRQVALKVPRLRALTQPALLERFHREARAAAGLDHPHIVPVYEAGEADGLCYIASAYCPGPTLATWLKEHHPAGAPPRIAAELLIQLADAVAYSHSRGVLHRDIKPGNVLLSPSSPFVPDSAKRSTDVDLLHSLTPRLADFGLAKIVEAVVGDIATPTDETGDSLVLGTPAYMAPEQIQGRSWRHGPAADIYSLGAVFYELLTGRPPFPGTNPIDVLDQFRTTEPVPIRRLRREVPRDLETICLKCLEKEPARRYASAHDFRDDLRRFTAGEPIRARPAGRWDAASKWTRRRPAVAALLLLGCVTAVAGVAGLWWHNRQLDRALVTENELRQKGLERERVLESVLYRQALPAAGTELEDHVGRPAAARRLLEQFIPRANDEPDVRGQEWHYLWSQSTGPPLLQTFAHPDGVPLRLLPICKSSRPAMRKVSSVSGALRPARNSASWPLTPGKPRRWRFQRTAACLSAAASSMMCISGTRRTGRNVRSRIRTTVRSSAWRSTITNSGSQLAAATAGCASGISLQAQKSGSFSSRQPAIRPPPRRRCTSRRTTPRSLPPPMTAFACSTGN